jgi:two-component system LytT family response regulator
MNIRALIVDDEELARKRLRKQLAAEADLEIVGECASGPEAIAALREQKADLVFLDVQMPEVNGFDVLRALPEEKWPAVVFVTAHDQHAISAFEVQALDYLLKPFTQARLSAAVARVRRHFETRQLASINHQLAALLKPAAAEPAYVTRLAIKAANQTLFIRVETIDYIEAAGNFAVVVTAAERHVLRETLTSLETKLSPQLFLRVSRSLIVNLDRIKGIQSNPGGDYLVLLQNGSELPMTRGMREVQEHLQYSANPNVNRGL